MGHGGGIGGHKVITGLDVDTITVDSPTLMGTPLYPGNVQGPLPAGVPVA